MKRRADGDAGKKADQKRSRLRGDRMILNISDQKGVPISQDMIGLFFEDINYAADGGLYAELIENRAFEFVDCYGTACDYYVLPDYGYGWRATQDCGMGKLQFVTGSPVNRNNPHYLRFTADRAGQGFSNQAYRGLYLKKGEAYQVSFYARTITVRGNFLVSVRKDGETLLCGKVPVRVPGEQEGNKWERYELTLTALSDTEGALFAVALDQPGTAEFDFFSMMPKDAVAGVFRRDLFELLKGLHPGFLRFPGGCIVEGNTLENRYRWKESVGPLEGRRGNFNRWAVHQTMEENGWHTEFSHYNQTLGLGFYEYFLLCELIGAKPLPVLNVGLACQYQSLEKVEPTDPAFGEFVQDALDLIEFANGSTDTYWGGLRAQMGHPEPFGLTMLGIGNEQWETPESKFFERYSAFEKAVHGQYPKIRLIGSAGPDIVSDRHRDAWAFYHAEAEKNGNFCYAVDEHYYVKPEWFLGHTDFYDRYPRSVKVFSGEYAAHPAFEKADEANTLGGALAEAAFLTGIERNADVVVLASYAPLFARIGYVQWTPDMIWFDERSAYGTPSYYVQKLYGEHLGTVTVPMGGQEKKLEKEGVYVNCSLREDSGELILKAVNDKEEEKELTLRLPDRFLVPAAVRLYVMAGRETDCNTAADPQRICVRMQNTAFTGSIRLEPMSFTVARLAVLPPARQ